MRACDKDPAVHLWLDDTHLLKARDEGFLTMMAAVHCYLGWIWNHLVAWLWGHFQKGVTKNGRHPLQMCITATHDQCAQVGQNGKKGMSAPISHYFLTLDVTSEHGQLPHIPTTMTFLSLSPCLPHHDVSHLTKCDKSSQKNSFCRKLFLKSTAIIKVGNLLAMWLQTKKENTVKRLLEMI